MRSEARWCCNYLGDVAVRKQVRSDWLRPATRHQSYESICCCHSHCCSNKRFVFILSCFLEYEYYHKFVWTTLFNSYAVVESYHHIIIGFSSSITLG